MKPLSFNRPARGLALAAAIGFLAMPPGPAVAATQAADAPGAEIGRATRALEQAALQANFASDARELQLLQQAHDDLSAVAGGLHGMRRERARWLLDDLEQAMHRADAQLGTLSSPDLSPGQVGFGPLVPDRNQLGALAIEAQELERGEPVVHRLIGTTVLGQAPPAEASAGAPASEALELANRELLAWPLGYEAAWPQIRVDF
jgi:hypothetical protein